MYLTQKTDGLIDFEDKSQDKMIEILTEFVFKQSNFEKRKFCKFKISEELKSFCFALYLFTFLKYVQVSLHI
jgi:hypothetical protein